MKDRISASNERVWCTTQLAKLSFNHSIGRTHSCRFSIVYKIIARDTIHNCSYTRERIMSSVSPYSKQCLVGDSHNINNDMRAADGSGDTLGLQEKAPSRGMRYLLNITNKFHVATRNTSSPTRTHTLWNKDAQRKEGATRTDGSMTHVSALDLVLLQQMGVEAKARATEEDRVNTTTCMSGT